MLIQQRQPIIQYEEYKAFLSSSWFQQNYLREIEKFDCSQDFIKLDGENKEKLQINQEQLSLINLPNRKAMLLTYFIYGYHIAYIDKQCFQYQFYKQFLRVINEFGKQSLEYYREIIDSQHSICKSTFLECAIMLLYQSTSLLISTEQEEFTQTFEDVFSLPESKLFYKQAYFTLMEQIKDALFKCPNEGQSLIVVCIQQLLNSETLCRKVIVQLSNQIRNLDTKFMIELMTTFIDSMEMPVHTTRQIIRQIFTINEEKLCLISKQIFINLKYSSDFCYLCLQAIRIWLKSKNLVVFQQIRSFLEEQIIHVIYDDISIKLVFQLLNNIQTNLVDETNYQEELLNELVQIFHILWESFEGQTMNQNYDQKTEFWYSYIHKLNLQLNPLTPLKNKQDNNIKQCAGLYLILNDQQTTKKYINSPNILLHFIDTIYPLDQQVLKTSQIMQNLMKSSIEYVLDPNLKDSEEVFVTIEKMLKQVQFLNLSHKQKIFQIVWSRWLPEDSFYIKILQQVVTIFLENGDQQLGTRNNFFNSILAMEINKKIVHPQKFHTLLQICQYLCLENAPINLEQIFSSHDIYANCLYLKKYKIKRSFQEFFQVNNYYSIIITLIAGIQNTTNLVYILKEFIKLEWLLTEGLKLSQVEFADDFVQFLEQKLPLFTDDQIKELIELLFDCSVSMISRFIRLTQRMQNVDYCGEIIIQNEFCLKVLVEVFIFNTGPSESLKLKCLQFLALLISSNQYNQLIFREAICLSNFLICMKYQKNKQLQIHMEEVLKRSLSFIRNDQIQKLIQNAPKESHKNKTFRQSAFSQYVGATLENLQNNGKDNKGKRQFQLLGKESAIFIKNYSDLSNKNWKSFTMFIEFKREGFCFINQNAKSIEETFKKEQVLLSIYGNIERLDKQANSPQVQIQQPNQKQVMNQIDLLKISLINETQQQQQPNQITNVIKLSVLNADQVITEVLYTFSQNSKDEMILLMVMFDEKHKGNFTIKAQNEAKKIYQIKPFLSEYNKKYSQKHHLSLSIGAQYQNSYCKNAFQGILNNFILVDNVIVQKQMDNIFIKTTSTLVEVVEREVMNFSSEETESREMHFLDLEKFKTSFPLVEIKDALRVTKAQNIQEQNFLMNMIKKQVQLKITYETNQNVKIFYQGVNIIEDVSLAEVFLSLENIEIILFIIQITTQTYFEMEPQQRRSNRLKSLKVVLGNHQLLNDKGVWKRTHYYDRFCRQCFFIKDLNKCREDYLNSQQYQLKLMKQNSSLMSQGESPAQQRKNYLLLDGSNDSNSNSIVVQQQEPNSVSQFVLDQVQDQVSLFNIPLLQIQTTFSQDSQQSPFIQKSYDGELKGSPTEPDQVDVNISRPISEKFPKIVLEKITVDKKHIHNSAQFQARKNTRHYTQNLSPKTVTSYNQSPTVDNVQSDKKIDLENKLRDSSQFDHNTFHCEWIRVKMQIYGELKIIENGRGLQFKSEAKERADKEFFTYGTIPCNLKIIQKCKTINTHQILEIFTRRYSHKEIAIEIFCKNTKSYFFVLFDQDKRAQFLHQIKQSNPIINIINDRRAEFQAAEYTKKWMKGKISNFEYLMIINKYAGRSFNDLNQYPIFPWVLNDYRSSKIDLNSRDSYRDLEKMISFLNPNRLENCRQKAESLRQTQPAYEYFIFGSHYSVAAQIINTLVRIEPFTSLQCELQDGKLDQPDRIFFSIPNTWDSCLNDNQDYRELIPEYFYLPEFLENINHIKFGQRQNNEPVNHVVLPPWAATCEEFIEINRRALESQFVSEKLHCWINNIFGINSQGEEAKKRDNIYHWLSYDTCWQELDKLPYEEKIGYLAQIQQFGQVPFQLFTKPHWQKQKIEQNFFTPEHMIRLLSDKKTNDAKRIMKFDKKVVIKVWKEGETVYTLLNNKQVYKLKYNQSQERRDSEEKLNGVHLSIGDVDKLHVEACCVSRDQSPAKNFKNTRPSHPTGQQFQFDDHMLFVSGYLNGGVYCYNLHYDKQQTPQISKAIRLHKKRVTCISYSNRLKILCLGAKDNRVTVWKLNYQSDKQGLQMYTTPKFILYGHEKTIKCLQIDEILQTIISVDKSGKLQIHSIISGLLLREMKFDLKSDELIWDIKSNGNGLIILLTNYSEIIVTRINGLKIQKYSYSNIGEISHIDFYQTQHLLVSTLKGEILLIQNICNMTNWHPIIFHIYQNTSNISIVTFINFFEGDNTLVFIICLIDGQVIRFSINAEQHLEFVNYLGRLGM